MKQKYHPTMHLRAYTALQSLLQPFLLRLGCERAAASGFAVVVPAFGLAFVQLTAKLRFLAILLKIPLLYVASLAPA